MKLSSVSCAIAVTVQTLAMSACSGGSSKSATSTPEPTATSAQSATFTIEQAQTLLADAALTPKDLPVGWKTMGDTTQDNVAAATADPAHAASIQRCGRLLGRTVANQPEDVVTAYIGGETVAFFSALTVYATVPGAQDCAGEAAQRYTQPGELARAFGNLFIDPNAVTVAAVDFPQIADGSFAADLTGQINAAGTQVALTILVVGFRKGNVTGAVGSAGSGAPSTDELKPYVDLVVQRVGEAQ